MIFTEGAPGDVDLAAPVAVVVENDPVRCVIEGVHVRFLQ
jgi:hypothetical protein